MRIVITGADGFIGQNLRVRLGELGFKDVVGITRNTLPEVLRSALVNADFVFHLAGVNRPKDITEFDAGNKGFTETLCSVLMDAKIKVPVAFASSIQAELANPYGRSKLAAENALFLYSSATEAPVYLFRLANVFGKWCRPNYNSAVATFCHNIARGMDITINDQTAPLKLVYIDDVIDAFTRLLNDPPASAGFIEAGPLYSTTVGEVAQILRTFSESRNSLLTPCVGTGFVRALHSTYISYLDPQDFAYEVPLHADSRGVFVEMLKTPACGQISYFTAHPGITRGEHYHHSKTEKFLVIKGSALFGFRNIITDETHELITRGNEARIVETAPGWTHNITNIGDDELVVLLWANEIFSGEKPDTISLKVKP